MSAAPNLFLIGAQKSGSTTLASQLVQSADVAYYAQKEPNIFSLPELEACRQRLQLLRRPRPAEPKWLLDASVDYSRYPLFPKTAEHIFRLANGPGLRFIYLVRDPVERTISHYFWNRQNFGETLELWDALESDHRYTTGSQYDVQIERYRAFFPMESFLFVKSEDYFSDIEGTCQSILAWLGAREPNLLDTSKRLASTDKDETRAALFPRFNRLVRSNKQVLRLAKSLIPQKHHVGLNRLLSRAVPRPPIRDEVKREIYARYFADTVDRTEQLTGLDLSDWRRPAFRPGTVQERGARIST